MERLVFDAVAFFGAIVLIQTMIVVCPRLVLELKNYRAAWHDLAQWHMAGRPTYEELRKWRAAWVKVNRRKVAADKGGE